jgi:hypothetical protein
MTEVTMPANHTKKEGQPSGCPMSPREGATTLLFGQTVGTPAPFWGTGNLNDLIVKTTELKLNTANIVFSCTSGRALR